MVKINSFRSGFSSLERREFSAREDAKCSSFFVRENKKKETGHRPLRGHEFARYCELRIFYREIFSRIGWLAASRRNRPSEHFSFHRSPPLPSPPHPATAIHLSVLPFFVPSFLSFLPFFQLFPSPAQQKPNKDARPFEKIDFARRSTEPRHAANVVLDAVKGGKEGESLLGDSFERE